MGEKREGFRLATGESRLVGCFFQKKKKEKKKEKGIPIEGTFMSNTKDGRLENKRRRKVKKRLEQGSSCDSVCRSVRFSQPRRVTRRGHGRKATRAKNKRTIKVAGSEVAGKWQAGGTDW